MNSSMIRVIMGHIMRVEAGLLLLPCIVACVYQERVGLMYLIVAGISFVLGSIFLIRKPKDKTLYLKEGCVATALSWIELSIIGAMPFVLTGEIPSYTDALFETISGFTTTGSSILSDVEALSYTSLFWRSLTHWIGGMGVLVFLLAIVSLSGGSTINLMKAESPGPSVGKFTPKIKSTARSLYLIYAGMTILQIILMLVGGCPLFDALTLSFGTAGTGGFGIKNDSLAGYSTYIQWVVTIFMMLFGINFNVYYYVIMKKFKEAFNIEEVRWYLAVIATSIAILFFNIRNIYETAGDAVRDAAFQVASIITTTGYATCDFDQWNTTCKVVIIFLMFIGACAGSTGGGIKVSRFIVMIRTMTKEIRSYIYPKSVKKIMFEGKPAEHEMVRNINVYMVTYILIFGLSFLLMSIQGEDLITTCTAVITCMNNIGPGLAKLGPTCNFGFLSSGSKYVLMFDMLAGRLELFPILILLHPKMLKDLFVNSYKNLKVR